MYVVEAPVTFRAPFVRRLLTVSRSKINRSSLIFHLGLISDLLTGAVWRVHVALVAAHRWYVEQLGCAALGIRFACDPQRCVSPTPTTSCIHGSFPRRFFFTSFFRTYLDLLCKTLTSGVFGRTPISSAGANTGAK